MNKPLNFIPFIHTPMFSKDFLARIRLDGKPRRLILHAGTPKTGTTSLQRHLDSRRAELAEGGVWYPPSSTPLGKTPKHQQIVRVLLRADQTSFVGYIEEALRDMPDSTHTVILSTEGIYIRWRDFPPRAKWILRYLADLFEFELCIWFREPVSFAAALYTQSLTDFRMQRPQENIYGQTFDFDAAMREDWFQEQLDSLGFYHEAQNLFGPRRVMPFVYSGDTVKTFLTHYAIGREQTVRATQTVRRENVRLTEQGVRLMRFVNRWRSRLPGPLQERVGTEVRRIDRILRCVSPSFRLNERQVALVNRYAGRRWAILQEECRKSAASRQAVR